MRSRFTLTPLSFAFALAGVLAAAGCRRGTPTPVADPAADAAPARLTVEIERDHAPITRPARLRKAPSRSLGQKLEAKLVPLRERGTISAERVGRSSTESDFHRIGREILDEATPAELEALLADDAPAVRAIGLWGYARQGMPGPLLAHLCDPEKVETCAGGCMCGTDRIGHVARDYLGGRSWLDYTLEAPLLDAQASRALSVRLRAADDCPGGGGIGPSIEARATWSGLRAQVPSVPAWKLVKAWARGNAGASAQLLLDILDDDAIPTDARLAAASGLTLAPAATGEGDIDASLRAHAPFLDGAVPGLSGRLLRARQVQRRWSAFRAREEHASTPSGFAELAGAALAVLEVPHPIVRAEMMSTRDYRARTPEVKAARAHALLAVADELGLYEGCWDVYRDTAYDLQLWLDEDALEKRRDPGSLSAPELQTFRASVAAAVARLDADARCR